MQWSQHTPSLLRPLLFLFLLALPLTGPDIAQAGKNARGAMIVHCLDEVVYTDTFDWCGDDYDDPGSCENAVTRSDASETDASVIWAIAAFHETSNPGVTVVYFGLDHNLPLGYVTASSFCGPDGTLEIPDAGWPDDVGAGNSIAFGEPIVGNRLFPFYWFGIYGFEGAYFGTAVNPTGGYAGFESDDIPSIPDECFNFGQVRWYTPGYNECPEPPALGACCFVTGECQLLMVEECTALGGDFQGDGTVCDPNPCPSTLGACCFADGHCEIMNGVDCEHYNGNWLGPETLCDPTPCDQPSEACCFTNGNCTFVPPEACEQAGGTPQGYGTTCEVIACRAPAMGACCLDDDSCIVTFEDECGPLGGIWNDGVACAPNPCSTSIEMTSWGRIKAGYR